MNRAEMLERALAPREPWDVVVIGGGATGVGVALDAAARGYDVLLLEQSDFGKGTSSRSTKLVHGGVRYLEQGNVSLVMEALKERGLLRQNAPTWSATWPSWSRTTSGGRPRSTGSGLKVYNLLSGRYGFGTSEILSKEETLARLPTIRTEGLRGGVVYYDGQFDDTRLLVNMATTAAEQGATLLNYAPVTALTRDAHGFVNGVVAHDLEGGREIRAAARVVINAGGPFCDAVRRLADPGLAPARRPQPGDPPRLRRVGPAGRRRHHGAAHERRPGHVRDPVARPHRRRHDGHADRGGLARAACRSTHEIEFVLETASRYLRRPLTRADVLSVFVGIRPLVRSGDAKSTSALSRDHVIHIDPTGLITVTGGKWTTWRSMAEHCVNTAAMLEDLPEKPCPTRNLNIHGFHRHAARFGPLAVYGSDALHIQDLIHGEPALGAPLHAALPTLRRRGGVGGAVRDGAHGRGRAGPAHAGPLPERPGGDRDGSRDGHAPGSRAGAATRRGGTRR